MVRYRNCSVDIELPFTKLWSINQYILGKWAGHTVIFKVTCIHVGQIQLYCSDVL